MVGITHVATRMVLREYLPENATTLWPTEMLNSKRLPFEDLARTPEAMRDESETELVPQILGNEETSIKASVAKLTEWGASGIDINMGCPVQKALRHNYGVALMGDADYAKEVVKMTVRNSSLPVSVKLRAGNQGNFDYLKKFVDGLVEGGVSWVTLHPRTAEQKRRGSADWEQIKKLKLCTDVPVIGNGDIQTDADVFAMLNETGCDMVMAGRALVARPWMLWQVGEALGFENPKGKAGSAPRTSQEQGAEYGRMISRLISYLRIYFTEELALRKLRFYIRTTSVWLPFGQTLVSLSAKGKTLDQVETLIANFFSSPVDMSDRTELRQ